MSEVDWDKIFSVHVKGAFHCTKAAWPYMRNQKYGRIIMTSSASGLYGSFGQTNYSSAKLALLGFANTLVLEGRKYNIQVNTVAPISETRMTIDLIGDSGMLLPDHVAPVVLYLCHEECEDSGSIIETGGGYTAKVKWQKTKGTQLKQYIGDCVTVENVAESWSEITDFSATSPASSPSDSMILLTQSIQNLPKQSPGEELVEQLQRKKFDNDVFQYTEDDIIKYALSVGAKIPDDIRFLFEGHTNFSALPSLASTFSVNSMLSMIMDDMPGMERLDMTRVLHGEQYLELLKPLPTSGKISLTKQTVDLLDKKKFCSLITENEIYDEDGNKLGMMQSVALFMGSGGVGRKGACPKHIKPASIPDRQPDATYEDETSTSQAALFRLNGDKNPIHIDSNMASMMGFQIPILHGLCSFGFALRHVLKTFADNDSSSFKSMKVQFSNPVIPGDTLVTEMWQEGTQIIFQMRVKDSGKLVLKGGYVDLKTVSVNNQFTSTVSKL